MQDLTISLVQESIAWQQPDVNRWNFGEIIQNHCRGSDLVVLPEMFTTGFDLKSTEHAEPMSGETVDWLCRHAVSANAHITGSVMIREDGKVFNRLLWAKPDGTLVTYDKRHLFSFAGENKLYTPGSERLIVDCRGWRCCPLVCYDLRFPVWSRNRQDYDLLLYVANWPRSRVSHWSSLLTARAIENLSYTVGVNRVGEDGEGNVYNGQSVILDPKGRPVVEPGRRAGCYTVTVGYAEVERYRNKFRALDDADTFDIT